MKAYQTTAIIFILLMMSNSILSQTVDDDPWWPHPIWGQGDQIGASNWITPEKVVESFSLVKTGKIYDLGFDYHPNMVFMGDRVYDLNIHSFGPMPEPYRLVGHTETLTASIGQISTQIDGLGHIGKRIKIDGLEKDIYYNGFKESEIYDENGLRNLGVENIKPIITRGIFIDIAAYKGVATLEDGYVVTLEDVTGALTLQGMDDQVIKEGDAILFHFGWWRNNTDKDKYMAFSTCP